MPTATTFAISGPSFTVSQGTDAGTAGIGNLGAATEVSTEVGHFFVQFVPNEAFQGSFQVVGRYALQATANVTSGTSTTVFVPVPYRAINIGGVSMNYAIQSDVLTGPWMILIPSSSLSVGFSITCTAGGGVLHIRKLIGPSVV